MKIKILAVFLVFVVIISLILFILGKIPSIWFWITIVFCAVMAYKVIPFLRKK